MRIFASKAVRSENLRAKKIVEPNYEYAHDFTIVELISIIKSFKMVK